MPEHALSVTHHAVAPEAARPRFYYDLASPESYLAAERVMADLPVVPEWVPIRARGLPGAEDAAGDAAAREAAIAARAAELQLQPLRWPPGWERTDARAALLAATFAKQLGRGVAFSLAAFRQAFAGGRDLADEQTALIAGAACELHPRALLGALGRASVGAALDGATAEAAAAGVRAVPAIRVGTGVFHGERGIDAAAAALATATPASAPAP